MVYFSRVGVFYCVETLLRQGYRLNWQDSTLDLVYKYVSLYSTVLIQKPNSWTYNFVEVSGHNLESSQAWGFLYGFLKPLGKGYGFRSGFLLSPLQCTVTEETVRGCVSLKKETSQGRAVEETVNSKEDNFSLLSGFRPRFRPLRSVIVPCGSHRLHSRELQLYTYFLELK